CRRQSRARVGRARARDKSSRSSVLKLDIAALFNRYSFERVHRSLQHTEPVVGIGRLAILAARSLAARSLAARSLLTSDAFCLLAELTARQVLKCRGINVDRVNAGDGLVCAGAEDCNNSDGDECAKAHGSAVGS